MPEKPYAAAAERNAQPILEALRHELRDTRTVLEIGSGTGQHAVFFGKELVQLEWQTSDLEENHPGIRQWLEAAELTNVLSPVKLDVRDAIVAAGSIDAVFSANTAHIMSFDAVEKMIELAGTALIAGGLFCLYGPFREHGRFNTASNEAFDAALRASNAEMGIRDLEALERIAASWGMARLRRYAMPANNELIVWRKA